MKEHYKTPDLYRDELLSQELLCLSGNLDNYDEIQFDW